MRTRYADDWVAVWNGSWARAEESNAEITTVLADELQLRLSDEKTLITPIDDGFDCLGYRITGDQRWGRWAVMSVLTRATESHPARSGGRENDHPPDLHR